MLEFLIANHCAPALAGIKPANIATCQKENIPDIHKRLKMLNTELNVRDIYIDILSENDKSLMLMVYRKNVLTGHLAERKNKAFLSKYGYNDLKTSDEYLNFLRSRLRYDDFPHEIGVFLGYPLRDIYCFINHRNEGCVLTGDWKVYHNVDEAEKIFKRFKACKRAVANKVASGKSLAEIFCAA